MKNHFVVVSEREEHVLWLSEALGPEGEAMVADDENPQRVAQLVDANGSNVVFVRVDAADLEPRCRLIRGLLGLKPHLAAVAISDRDDPGVMLAAIRAGARDFMRVGSDRDEVNAVVERLLENEPSQDGGPGRGKLVSLLCGRPDAASSTVAVHLALALVQMTRESDEVLLVDLGVPAADSLLYLDLKPSYSFVDATRSVRRFDQTLIQTAFTRHRSGLAILPVPDDPAEMKDVTPTDAIAVLSVLKSYFHFTVVNLGGLRVPEFLLQVLGQSDETALLVDQSVLSCGSARKLIEGLSRRDAPTKQLRLVVDRYLDNFEPDATSLAEILGLEVMATLPPSGLSMLRAMNSGTSIFDLEPDSRYARAVRDLAAKLAGREPSDPARRRKKWWRRPGAKAERSEKAERPAKAER